LHSRVGRAFLLAVFFASGFAALLYQTIWQRMLTLFGGADVYSITIIVAAFMAGLGFGNMAGGHLADRLPLKRCLHAFAVCELAIGGFALLSTFVYYDWLYLRLGGLSLSRAAMGTAVFLVTLWPTFFMGMSLPLVSRLAATSVDQSTRWIPTLYGWNTVGAAAGSLLAVGVLFPRFSFQTSLSIGAALSVACGLTALVLAARGTVVDDAAVATAVAPVSQPSGTGLPLGLWLGVYAMSGFIALSLEIVWFRVLGVVLKSNGATFGFLLAVFLAGLGWGSLVARRRLFGRVDPTRAFFTLQALVPLCAAGSLMVFIAAVDRVGVAEPLWAVLADPEPLGAFSLRNERVVILYMALGLGLIFPSTACMGMSFALLQRAVQTDVRLVGRRVGWLQTANIVGSMAGALLTGLFLLDRLGSAGTLRLLVAWAVVFPVSLWAVRPEMWRRATAVAAGLAVVAVALPGNAHFWSRLHRAWPADTITRENATGVVLLKHNNASSTNVFLGGFSQSWFPYGGIHTALGALPALIHPNPEEVAVIGLASGDTAFSIGGRSATRTIDSIEIMSAQHAALQDLARLRRFPALQMLLDDPRVRHHFTDARAFLRKEGRRYDLIEADALMPTSAYAGNLYSVEYFELLRRSLKPGGYAVTWTPSERTRESFVRVFPFVLLFRSIAIGSDAPIVFDPDTVRSRLSDPFTQAHYGSGRVDVEGAIAPFLHEGAVSYGPDFDRSVLTDVNRDLFPQDEFGRPHLHDGRLIEELDAQSGSAARRRSVHMSFSGLISTSFGRLEPPGSGGGGGK
jgi:predicted membrane-bound spermidine synthase